MQSPCETWKVPERTLLCIMYVCLPSLTNNTNHIALSQSQCIAVPSSTPPLTNVSSTVKLPPLGEGYLYFPGENTVGLHSTSGGPLNILHVWLRFLYSIKYWLYGLVSASARVRTSVVAASKCVRKHKFVEHWPRFLLALFSQSRCN